MREIKSTIYEAFDGTRFLNEFECACYEYEKTDEQLIFFDANMQVIGLDLLSSAFYIFVNSEEAWNTLKKISDLENCYSPTDCEKIFGLWCYDNTYKFTDNDWVHIDTQINYLNKEIQKLKKFKNELDKEFQA